MVEKIRVLIVDDEDRFAESLSDILSEKGYEATVVNSGTDALGKIEEITFDVILMDVVMPVMNGVETFRQIKKVKPKTVVIMMTRFSFSVEDLVKVVLELGAFGCVSKPLDIDNLLEQIELAVEETC